LNSIAEALARAKAPCITSSFQAECVVLTHMLLESTPHIPVLFLDTVHHFAETYAYRDDIAGRWKLNLINLRAARSLAREHRSLLRGSQGRTAVCRAGAVRRLVHGVAPRPVAIARQPPGG
jgi:3'-phosphoadenosine 5'-phosphosulfate sulfotransferase (PAPS reductase)/FAD synthetase